MTFLLLTGAGFSRNWGGWLASEAFEYLLGAPELDEGLRHILWKSKAQGGGFEDALAELQEEYNRSQDARAEKALRGLQGAIVGMFNYMDQAFAGTTFEPQNRDEYLVRNFLVRFDAIFTLNQDLLLERHYLDDNVSLSSGRRWSGWQMPGIKPFNPAPHTYDPTLERTAARTPETNPADFKVDGGLQPYFKLHGSSNWVGGPNGRILVVGGNKAVEINQYPVLRWYHEQFAQHLSRPGTRLMVIGYSFSDQHINRAIMDAADRGGLRMFIIDSLGVDVLDKQDPRHPLRIPNDLMTRLNPHIIGASRRALYATFGSDRVEHGKLMRFFSP
jgi:hypothetical protein